MPGINFTSLLSEISVPNPTVHKSHIVPPGFFGLEVYFLMLSVLVYFYILRLAPSHILIHVDRDLRPLSIYE